MLDRYLSSLPIADSSLIIEPRIGEDTAAVDVHNEEIIVLKSDPITFAGENIAEYAVIVNANDIVTSGAVPRWFLTTVLLPPSCQKKEAETILVNLRDMCKIHRITLCGGHSEVTDAVTRPIVSGTLIGTVTRNELIDKRMMDQGDDILVTKRVAVEGTSLIAADFEQLLQKRGVEQTVIAKSRRFLSSIAILEEARIAKTVGGISALHDVTEGGFATAVRELAAAGGHTLSIELDTVPVYKETEMLCKALRIDPFGLIGSGSLLLCCRPSVTNRLIEAIEKEGIEVTAIGTVGTTGDTVKAFRNGQEVTFPRFSVDELTKLFNGTAEQDNP